LRYLFWFHSLLYPRFGFAGEYTTGKQVRKEKTKEEAKKAEKKKAVKMEEMVVTATRTETPVENLPQNVTIIKAEDMEGMHVKTVDDVLNREGGIEIIRSYGLGYSGWVIMRGVGDKKRTLIHKDGITLNDMRYSGFSDWNEISAGDIEWGTTFMFPSYSKDKQLSRPLLPTITKKSITTI